MLDLTKTITESGGDPTSLKFFNQPKPELLAYATLVGPDRQTDDLLSAIQAVYEWQGSPLLFLVDSDDLQDHPDRLLKIRRLLAMRGDAPYLGVAAHGRLTIYPIALDSQKSLRGIRNLHEGDQADHVLLPWLANERPDAALGSQRWISDVILGLLTESIELLICSKSPERIESEDAISIVGRALFTRFLADRSLLPLADRSLFPEDCDEDPAGLFDDADRAIRTSEWLDRTFNGDLLPLSSGIFDALTINDGYKVLGNILRRARGGQLSLGWEEKWDRLDFAHIPVGVLSQAYELYLRKHDQETQTSQSGYYTPRPIADLMVSAAFKSIESRDGHRCAKVLDPSAGAGVFLLTAFRELVATEWRQTGIRPSTKRLREILYGHITGFDVNESALRFGSLGLYLIAIELDPCPQPVDKLAFSNLRGNVLHLLRDEDGRGSLGLSVGDEHKNLYDIVIGNPPWAKGTNLANWQDTELLVKKIAEKRGVEDTSRLLSMKALDLPFVWRAMEWAKTEGLIAFVLHGRLLFQQHYDMPHARQAIFDALDVISIVNGSELRQTDVWPKISAPFCLLFARNRPPTPVSAYRFVSPHCESSLNKSGRMRIDALNADFISNAQLRENPELFKMLFRGSTADVEIIERLRKKGYPTVEAYWHRETDTTSRPLLYIAKGYKNFSPSNGGKGVDASYLHGLPEIDRAALSDILINASRLPAFQRDRIYSACKKKIFSGPLLLVHKSLPAKSKRLTTAVSDADVCYNQTFYGFSTGTHPEAELLVRYFALVLGSRFATWWTLMTCGGFGVERDVVPKATLERMPVPNFDKLDDTTLRDLRSLFDRLSHRKCTWEDVDRWVYKLYDLSGREIQTIIDTLDFSLPFRDIQRSAEERPSERMQDDFCSALREELLPWCLRFGTEIDVCKEPVPWPEPERSPWCCIRISIDSNQEDPSGFGEKFLELLRAADTLAASEMDIPLDSNCLLHARLAQARYWTVTQAQLYAEHIIWTHLDLLKSRESV